MRQNWLGNTRILPWLFRYALSSIQYDKPQAVLEAESEKLMKLEKIAATEGLGVSKG